MTSIFAMSRYDKVSSSSNGQFGTGVLGVPNVKIEN